MTEEECVAAARRWKRRDLVRILGALLLGATEPGWAPGKDFEYLIIRAFELERVQVAYPFRVAVHDGANTTEQIDGSVLHQGTRFLIESKAWDRRVDRAPLALLTTQLSRRPPQTMGSVFTLFGYTAAALALTNMTSPIRLLLWVPEELRVALTEGAMTEALAFKYRWAQEQGVVGAGWGADRWSAEVSP